MFLNSVPGLGCFLIVFLDLVVFEVFLDLDVFLIVLLNLVGF